MNGLEQDLWGTWANRVAIRLVDAAFAACAHLPYSDRQLLLREIAKRALWHTSSAPAEPRQPLQAVEGPNPKLSNNSGPARGVRAWRIIGETGRCDPDQSWQTRP
jgi:hypothetical protein